MSESVLYLCVSLSFSLLVVQRCGWVGGCECMIFVCTSFILSFG